MDLSLTSRADYAIRASICLARHFGAGEYRKVREIAQEMGLPLRYTPQILGLLTKAGIAEAKAGQTGGHRLLRSPAAISVLELVEAAEGPLQSDRCTLSGGPCHWQQMCALHPVWAEAQDALRHALAAKTLAAVLEVDQLLAAGKFPVPESSHRRKR